MYIIKNETLVSIADSIREKTGEKCVDNTY